MTDNLKLILDKEDLKKLEKSDVIGMIFRKPFSLGETNMNLFAYDGEGHFLDSDKKFIYSWDISDAINNADAPLRLIGDGAISVSHALVKMTVYDRYSGDNKKYFQNQRILIDAGLFGNNVNN